MKIALIGPAPPPNGGMAMQTQQLYRLLKENGHDVSFIATNEPYRPQWVGRIVILRALFRLISYCWLLSKQLKHQQIIHLMANSGWSFYLFAMPVIYIGSWYRVPIIVNYRGGNAKPFFAKSWRMVKGAFARVDRVIVPSNFLRQIFAEYQIETQVIPNIVDLSMFHYKPPNFEREPLHLVITRNLESIYDNATAIRAFAQFYENNLNSRLTVAGNGIEEQELKQLTAELGVSGQVNFVGRQSREQIALLYQSADILLNTSLIDNTPNSIIEALACGVIVVSTNVGGIPYLVEDGRQALLVAPKRPDLIAEKLSQIVLDRRLRQKLSDNGFQLVSQFSPLSVVPMLESLYQKLVVRYA